MNFKAIILAAAVIAQPLALITINPAVAASVGGGAGGPGGPGGNGEGTGSIMQSGNCPAWSFQRAEEAIRLQKKLCAEPKSAESGSLRRL